MNQKKQKVWIVDDEAELAEAFSNYLSKGFETRAFNSAEAALETLQRQPQDVDLIVTDIKMPGMDGLTFLEKVKKQNAQLPVVMVSGYAEKDHLLKATSLSVSGFLEKPLSPADLEGTIKKILAEYYFSKLKDQLIYNLVHQASVSSELLSSYLDRYIHAENIVTEKNIPLHSSAEEIHTFLLKMKKENQLNRKLEELAGQLDQLQKVKAN